MNAVIKPARRPSRSTPANRGIAKCPTGIAGLDEVLGGGLPLGRPTLICGGPGSGKTLLAMEFLLRGVTTFGEPGVFMAFEETEEELSKNVRSLGFDVDKLVAANKLAVDFVQVERSEITETGEYDLEGLFLRLGLAIDSVKAKRVVLDTIESLFSGFSNHAMLRAEIRRLFRWLKAKGVTAVITGERGDGLLTRQGLEEYVSDCVIALDHRVLDQISTRRLRVVKYRGTSHGTNEYPFLIDETGISVLPLTSLLLDHAVSAERISTGMFDVDAMLGSKGFFRGSSILVSGSAGTGKSSVAAHFVEAACRRGERGLYFAFEESPRQISRNMRSIGIDLDKWSKKGLLRIEASRPTLQGLEMHLVHIHKLVASEDPNVVVVDPITTFFTGATAVDAGSMILRLVDFLKSRGVTAMFAHPMAGSDAWEQTEVGISSLIDTWILLRDVERGANRLRGLSVLKSRGMNHSRQLREFAITARGIKLGADREPVAVNGSRKRS